MKQKKFHVGKNLSVSKNWKFTADVSRHFDVHVNQSIPEYKEMQKYIASLSQFFIKDNCNIYDIGCSTGQTIKKILEITPIDLNLNITGLDNQKEMLTFARKKFTQKHNNNKHKIKFLNSDILKTKLKNSNLIICCLLFNFFNKKNQKKILKKIYKSLNKKGALIVVNKVVSENGDQQTIFDQLYNSFKIDKKLTPNEIINKQIALRTSMTLSTVNEDMKELNSIGFKKVEVFYKWFNFTGYIAIK